MMALLAPQEPHDRFKERVARLLGGSTFQLETHLNRLRQTELVAEHEGRLRIVPDLFSDFLVYEVCYGPSKRPDLVQGVLREFADRGAALLRNLSEATWLARLTGVTDDALIGTVLKAELARFADSTFADRAQTLRYWTGFSVYLPAETLRLARLALELSSAPRTNDDSEVCFPESRSNSHASVLEELSSLLRPVALHHDRYRLAPS